MLLRQSFILMLVLNMLSSFAQAQDALTAGPSAFVLIARLHAMPGQSDQLVELSAAVDRKVEAGEPGMLLHTFDRDPGDSQGFIWTEVCENSEALIFHLNNHFLTFLCQFSALWQMTIIIYHLFFLYVS